MPKIIKRLTGTCVHRVVLLDPRFIGYTRDKFAKAILRNEIHYNMQYESQEAINRTDLDIQPHCERYNETYSTAVYDTIERHFDDVQKGLQVPGWPAGQYPPHLPAPPINEIGKLGEGLSGWYMEEQESYEYIHRPINVFPDAILQKDDNIALIEIKTTTRLPGSSTNIIPKVVGAAVDLVDFWAKIHHITGSNPYVGYSIGVKLLRVSNIDDYGSDLEIYMEVLRLELL